MNLVARIGQTYGANNVLDEALGRIEMEETSDTLRKTYGSVARCTIRLSASQPSHKQTTSSNSLPWEPRTASRRRR